MYSLYHRLLIKQSKYSSVFIEDIHHPLQITERFQTTPSWPTRASWWTPTTPWILALELSPLRLPAFMASFLISNQPDTGRGSVCCTLFTMAAEPPFITTITTTTIVWIRLTLAILQNSWTQEIRYKSTQVLRALTLGGIQLSLWASYWAKLNWFERWSVDLHLALIISFFLLIKMQNTTKHCLCSDFRLIVTLRTKGIEMRIWF